MNPTVRTVLIAWVLITHPIAMTALGAVIGKRLGGERHWRWPFHGAFVGLAIGMSITLLLNYEGGLL